MMQTTQRARLVALRAERSDLVQWLESASAEQTDDGTAGEAERAARALLDTWDIENGEELRTLLAEVSA